MDKKKEKNKLKKQSFEIGCLSFLLAFLCPPLWIFLYLLIYSLNKENYDDDIE